MGLPNVSNEPKDAASALREVQMSGAIDAHEQFIAAAMTMGAMTSRAKEKKESSGRLAILLV